MSMFQSNLHELDYGHSETGDRAMMLSRFFNGVYLWMAIALLWTALVSAVCATVPQFAVFMKPGLIMTAGIAAFVVSILAQSIALRVNAGVGLALFLLYATLIGIAIAPIWVIYRSATVGAAFVLTGGIFFVMSIVGHVTKMDLSRVRAIAIMIVWGLLLASVVNIFLASSAMSWIITYVVVIVFPILIATQTQMLKQFVLEHGDNGTMVGRVAILGALQLYIAFLNIFLAILRILGGSGRR